MKDKATFWIFWLVVSLWLIGMMLVDYCSSVRNYDFYVLEMVGLMLLIFWAAYEGLRFPEE